MTQWCVRSMCVQYGAYVYWYLYGVCVFTCAAGGSAAVAILPAMGLDTPLYPLARRTNSTNASA